MNVLIFDHLSQFISLQASNELVRDFFYHPDALSFDNQVVEHHIQQSVRQHAQMHEFYRDSQVCGLIGDATPLSFSSIAPQQLSYAPNNLVILDFATRHAVFRHCDFNFAISLEFIYELNPEKMDERDRLLEIERLLCQNLLTLDPTTTLSTISGEPFLDIEQEVKKFSSLIEKKLSGNDPYIQSHNQTPQSHLSRLYSAPSLCINPNSSYFEGGEKWTTSEYYGFASPREFVLETLELLISKNLILTPEQEAAWHCEQDTTAILSISQYLPPETFEPLNIARQKEKLQAEILKPAQSARPSHKL